MNTQTIGAVAGKPNTPLNDLFSSSRTGWMDMVNHKHYPLLDEMIAKTISLPNHQDVSFKCFSFNFPQSLDDFGLLNALNKLYDNRYKDYASQWSKSDRDVVDQQIQIQEAYQAGCPANSNNCLYFMVSDITRARRVVYIGIAKNGLLLRFYNGNTVRPQDNNYIGDCRSNESKANPKYTWRVKSAALRQRAVSRIYWTILCKDNLKSCEKTLIKYKLELIKMAFSSGIRRDPANR